MAVYFDAQLDEHRWTLKDHQVTQLILDPSAFRFQTWTLAASAEIRCGVPFTYREADGIEHTLDPDAPESLAPLLGLLMQTLLTVTVTRLGNLAVTFGDGSELRVTPHPAYEAWEINGSGELEEMGYLCGPGGGSPWG